MRQPDSSQIGDLLQLIAFRVTCHVQGALGKQRFLHPPELKLTSELGIEDSNQCLIRATGILISYTL